MGQLYRYIKIDRDLCIGAASCVAVYPEIFQLDEENKAIILKKDGGHTSDHTSVDLLSCANVDDDQLLLAAQSCPTAAIFLYGEDGGQLYPES
jgi:ferredoxin